MRPAATACVALLLGAALIGCGFQLRGAVDIPPDLSPVFVRGSGRVSDSIEARLLASGVQSTDAPASAGLVVEVLSEGRSSRVVAVDRNGKALAYMLTYWVRFAAEDRDGRQLIAPTDLTLERTFDDNPDVAVLGKQEEADMIYADMAEDAADQLLLRLRAALASRASPGASPGA